MEGPICGSNISNYQDNQNLPAAGSHGLRCPQCGACIPPGGYVWQVVVITGEGLETFRYACSLRCARALQEENLRMHMARVDTVRNQGFQKMSVEDLEKERKLC